MNVKKYDCCDDIGNYFEKSRIFSDRYCIDSGYRSQVTLQYCPFCGQDQDNLEANYEVNDECL